MKTDYNPRQSSAAPQLSILKERYPASKQNWSIWIQVHHCEETATMLPRQLDSLERLDGGIKTTNVKSKCMFGEMFLGKLTNWQDLPMAAREYIDYFGSWENTNLRK